MKLSNVKIGPKILAIITAFGVSSVGMAFWQNSMMADARQQYNHVISNLDTASIAASRMSENVYGVQGAINGLAFETCPSAACDIFERQIKSLTEKFDERYEQVVQFAPEYEKDYRPFKERFDPVAEKISGTLIPEALHDDNKTLQVEIAALAKDVDSLTSDIRATTDEKLKSNEAAIAQLNQKLEAQSRIAMFVSIALVILVTALAALLAFGDISRSLRKATEQMRRVADGELNFNIDGKLRGDEIGMIAKTLSALQEGLRAGEQVRTEAETQKAKAEADRRALMLGLADDFETSVGGIVTLVSAAATEMQASATQLTASAQETAAQSVAVAAASEEAGTNVTSVASAAEELGASVSEISRQVETSTKISAEATKEAISAVKIVNDLNEVTVSIGDVVTLIAGLASQTNLLALNATIESARAGEAGRGFAVVASEVKALAGQTAKATSDISAKIAQIQAATGRAADAIKNITGTIEAVSVANSTIASAVEQQSGATHEIIRAVNQASMGTNEVSNTIAGVAQAAEQTGDAAAQVLSSSSELAQQAARLSHEMDKFLSTVRAA